MEIGADRGQSHSIDFENGGDVTDEFTRGSSPYLGNSENRPETRSVDDAMQISNIRYGKLIQNAHGPG